MSIGKYLDPKNDYAFKKIFGTEKHKDILIHFLNDILEPSAPIIDLDFIETRQSAEYAYKKESIVDVLCQDNEGAQYVVEMQVVKTPGFEKRAQYYAAKAYINQMRQGGRYSTLKQVIFLAITDFVMFPDKPYYKSDHVVLDKLDHTHDLKDFSFTFIELPKFPKSIEDINRLETILEKWCYFFKYASRTDANQVEAIVGEDGIIGDAYTALDQYFWTEEEVFDYERQLKHEMDAAAVEESKLGEATQKGLEQGLEQGIDQGLKLAAQHMFKEGLAIEMIQRITGLSMEMLETLKNLNKWPSK